jgi:hypothetical protein
MCCADFTLGDGVPSSPLCDSTLLCHTCLLFVSLHFAHTAPTGGARLTLFGTCWGSLGTLAPALQELPNKYQELSGQHKAILDLVAAGMQKQIESGGATKPL